jgi:DNA-binding transcriptional regulator YdaS (Cro superfamily)
MPERNTGLSKAIKKAGGVCALARAIGITSAALAQWKQVPSGRILQVEAVTRISRAKLRPDLYRK